MTAAEDDLRSMVVAAGVVFRELDDCVRQLGDRERVEAGLLAVGFARAALAELDLVAEVTR